MELQLSQNEMIELKFRDLKSIWKNEIIITKKQQDLQKTFRITIIIQGSDFSNLPRTWKNSMLQKYGA